MRDVACNFLANINKKPFKYLHRIEMTLIDFKQNASLEAGQISRIPKRHIEIFCAINENTEENSSANLYKMKIT